MSEIYEHSNIFAIIVGFFVTHEIQFNYKFNPQRRTKNLDRLWAFVFTVKIVWDIGHQAPPVQLQNLFFDCQFFVCPCPLLSVGTTIPKVRNDPPALVGNKQTFPKLHLSLECDQYYGSCSNFNWREQSIRKDAKGNASFEPFVRTLRLFVDFFLVTESSWMNQQPINCATRLLQ